jgi:hypothetical protein
MRNPAMFLCPWHDEKTPSLAIDFTKNRAYCFGCDKSATVNDVIQAFVTTSLKVHLKATVPDEAAGEWLVEASEGLISRVEGEILDGLSFANVEGLLRGMLDEYDTLLEMYEEMKRG